MEKMTIEIKSLDESKGFKVDSFMDIFNLLSKETSPDVSIVVAKLNGKHSKRVNFRSIKIYYVLEGHLLITSDGLEKNVYKNSLIKIPPNITIELLGENCEFIIFCCPAFEESDEEIFDEPN